MANAFTPTITGSFDGELVWNMTSYVVSDNFKNYVESMEVVYRDVYINHRTGFETTKRVMHANTGTDILIDISITLIGSLSRGIMQQLQRLAQGVSGAGMELTFRDDWWESYQYSCRWINAGQFVENSNLLCGGRMDLVCWDRNAL
jgi:hypothetical protein